MAPLSSKLTRPLIFSAWLLALSAGCSGSVEPAAGDGDGDASGDGDGDTLPGGDGDGDALPGGDGDGDGDGDGAPRGCNVGGVQYAPGDPVPSDGCNSCSCERGGAVTCTALDCGDGDVSPPPRSCEVDGVVYSSGASFTLDCNTCGCSDGIVSCTLIACGEPDDPCTLPFEGGDCDGALSVYWHNPASGQCEPNIYGGCGGNDNRFESLEQCRETCGGSPPGQSCEVNGVVYPDGAMNVPDPASCNTCACVDGLVTSCTEIGCPTECEEGTALGSECSECGPTDACLIVTTGCLPTCESQGDCAIPGGACLEGLCKNTCP